MKTRSWSAPPAVRARRKQDLLLASQLMRLHADTALRDIGDRADLWAGRFQLARRFASQPAVVAGTAVLAFTVARWWRPRRRAKEAPAPAPARRSAGWSTAWRTGLAAWRLWQTWVALRQRAS